jgi:nucleoside-diphosphate-sugar epimerase
VLVLVTGGTGFIGRFAVRSLQAAGHDVRVLVRDRARALEVLGEEVELALGGALDVRAVRTALVGCDALVQSAGVYSYDRRHASRMLAETPALAEAVLTAAMDAGVPRVVDVASVVVFTTETDRVVLSTRLAAPGDRVWVDPYARAKVAAERFGVQLEERGLPRVTLHPTRVLGPEDQGPGTSGASVIMLMRGGTTTDSRGGWVDVRDVADAAVAALAAPVGTHAILNASSMRYRELAPLLDRLTGRTHRRTFVPPGPLRALARVNDRLGGRLIEGPTAAGLEYVLTSPPIDGSSGEALLGRPYRSLEESLVDSIRWWAANGTIDAKLSGSLAA